MRLDSLAFRLFVASAGWAFLLIAVGAIVLSQLYRQTVERDFEARLQVFLTALIGNVQVSPEGTLGGVGPLGEPKFETLFSGWYWQIRELNQDPGQTLSSRSLWVDQLQLPSEMGQYVSDGQTVQASVKGPQGEPLRVMERRIRYESTGRAYSFAVAGNTGELDASITAFRWRVTWSLIVFAAGLVATTLFLVRFGLRPLRDIGNQLAAIRGGAATRLDGKFPAEIEPLAVELNALIESNRAVVERARTHVGNLAHALKTPLSVIANEAASDDTPLAHKVTAQIGTMREQIDHYLQRARMAARANVIGVVTDARPALDALARAMNKIYEERGIRVEVSGGAGVKFAGERQDFDEMAGNLMDNACKWARSRVTVHMEHVGAQGGERAKLRLTVDDDGSGLSEDECREVLRRGARLDESMPGSGLGLSIVAELASLYNATFSLSRAPAGGLRASLDLPAA